MRHFAIFLCFFLVLSGCAAKDQLPYRSLSFSEVPYHLQIGRIVIDGPYSLPENDIQLAYQLPMTLKQGVEAWLNEKIRPMGSGNYLEVRIHHASMVRTSHPGKREWWQLSRPEEEVFLATLNVTLTIYAPGDRKLATAHSNSEQKMTLPGDVDMSRRDALLNDLFVRTLQDMDLNFSRAIPEYMAPHLIKNR